MSTRHARPLGMQAAGAVVTRLLDAGLPMGPLWLLQTRGRRTGRVSTVPVAVLRHAGVRWLVSPFGAVAWVHNVRANGEATLTRGRRSRPIGLAEVTDERGPAVLRAYRRRFAAVPFVRAAFSTTGRDPLSAFTDVAARHPVFLVVDERT